MTGETSPTSGSAEPRSRSILMRAGLGLAAIALLAVGVGALVARQPSTPGCNDPASDQFVDGSLWGGAAPDNVDIDQVTAQIVDGDQLLLEMHLVESLDDLAKVDIDGRSPLIAESFFGGFGGNLWEYIFTVSSPNLDYTWTVGVMLGETLNVDGTIMGRGARYTSTRQPFDENNTSANATPILEPRLVGIEVDLDDAELLGQPLRVDADATVTSRTPNDGLDSWIEVGKSYDECTEAILLEGTDAETTTTAPDSVTTTPGDEPPASPSPLALRADGIGATSLLQPMAKVEAEITGVLGPPDLIEEGQCAFDPNVNMRQAIWGGLAVYGTSTGDQSVFDGWFLEGNDPDSLATESGISIGSTVEEVDAVADTPVEGSEFFEGGLASIEGGISVSTTSVDPAGTVDFLSVATRCSEGVGGPAVSEWTPVTGQEPVEEAAESAVEWWVATGLLDGDDLGLNNEGEGPLGEFLDQVATGNPADEVAARYVDIVAGLGGGTPELLGCLYGSDLSLEQAERARLAGDAVCVFSLAGHSIEVHFFLSASAGSFATDVGEDLVIRA